MNFLGDTTNLAGFTSANTSWLPVNENYETTNVKTERATAGSHLNVFKRLVQLRKARKVLQEGSTDVLADDNLLIIKRELSQPRTQLFVVLNFGSADQNFALTDYFTTAKRLYSASVVSDNLNIRQGYVIIF